MAALCARPLRLVPPARLAAAPDTRGAFTPLLPAARCLRGRASRCALHGVRASCRVVAPRAAAPAREPAAAGGASSLGGVSRALRPLRATPGRLAAAGPGAFAASAPALVAAVEPLLAPLSTLLARAGRFAAPLALSAALLLATPAGDALAASTGGRVGGSAFSSRASSSSAESSSSSSSDSFSSSFDNDSSSSFSYSYSSQPTRVIMVPSDRDEAYVASRGSPSDDDGGGIGGLVMLVVFILIVVALFRSGGGDGGGAAAGGDRVAVVRLQVGLLGLARGLQAELDEMAGSADTSSPAGLHAVLQEAVLALMRHPDYCVYAHSSDCVEESTAAGERAFVEMSLEARSKFARETLSNVNAQKAKRAAPLPSGPDGSAPPNEFIVVTLLVAAAAPLTLPPVATSRELAAALSALARVAPADVLAVEVVWSPQAQGDALSKEDLERGYPQLQPL